MKTNRGLLGIVLSLIVLQGSSLYGAGLMGPPMAVLEEGQWTVGLEYAYAETDLKAHGAHLTIPDDDTASYTAELVDLQGLSTRMVFGNLAYGICDNWDLFLRLGTADVEGRVRAQTIPYQADAPRFGYDGSFGLACGIGSRATFCHWGPWQFGGTMQVSWLDPGDSAFAWTDPGDPNSTAAGRMDIDLWQAQLALAATYQIDTFRFWAGPFLQFVRGDFDRHGETFMEGTRTGRFTGTSDIEETSQVGIHFGTIWEASDRVSCWVEGQYTNDSWVVGVSGIIEPKKFLPEK